MRRLSVLFGVLLAVLVLGAAGLVLAGNDDRSAQPTVAAAPDSVRASSHAAIRPYGPATLRRERR